MQISILSTECEPRWGSGGAAGSIVINKTEPFTHGLFSVPKSPDKPYSFGELQIKTSSPSHGAVNQIVPVCLKKRGKKRPIACLARNTTRQW